MPDARRSGVSVCRLYVVGIMAAVPGRVGGPALRKVCLPGSERYNQGEGSEPVRTTLLASWQRRYVDTIAALAATMMAAVVGVMTLQVFYRYFMADPLIWAEEVCRYLLIWMTFLSLGAAFQRGDIAVITILTNAMGRRLRALIMVPPYLLTAGFLGFLVFQGWIYAEENLLQTIPGIDYVLQSLGINAGLSIFWVYISLPIGCAILALHIVLSALRVTIDAFAPNAAEG